MGNFDNDVINFMIDDQTNVTLKGVELSDAAFKSSRNKPKLGEEYEYIFNRAPPGINDGAIRTEDNFFVSFCKAKTICNNY